MKSITKATAKKAVRLHCSEIDSDKVKIDSETVTIWFDLDSAEAAEKAAQAVASECGGCTIMGNGSKWDVYYRRQPVDLGDYNDKSSRWHY